MLCRGVYKPGVRDIEINVIKSAVMHMRRERSG